MITDLKKRAIHRSRILQGQMKGLEKMIGKEEYCMDIITQSLAIQKSLGSLNKLVLENHLKTHIMEEFSSGSHQRRQQAAQELIDLYELTNIRANNKSGEVA